MVESHRQEIAKLEALYATNPGGRVFVHLAEALRRAGEHERARSILEEGLARHPDSASGYVVLGRVLIDRGETAEAEAAFRRVLQLDSGNLVALRCLGDLARRGGRPAEATVHYRELIARNPSSAGDSGLVRLLEEAQLRAAEAAAAAAAAAATREEEVVAAEAAAAAVPVEAELGGVAGEAEAEAVAPSDSAAPGRAGPVRPAVPEYGTVELDALPGDLASFAGLAAPERARAVDETEPEPRMLEDDVVVLIESSAAPLELEELETELAASPAEVNLLSALPEPEMPAPEQPPTGAPPQSLQTTPADAATLEPVPDATVDVPGLDMAATGDMDVEAVLDLSELSSVAPFEVVPEATELTLVDDDTVRVSMPVSDQPREAGEEVAAGVGEPALADEAVPGWVMADAGLPEDVRTQDAADLAAADAPELADAAELAAADAPEHAAADAAELAAGAAADAPELAAGAAPEHAAADAPELAAAAAGETAPDEDLPWLVEPAEAAGPGFVEGIEEEAGRALFADTVEHAPELAAFSEVPEPDRALADQDAEWDRARFAEDVEAEPDLDTFMEEFEAGRNAAGFVVDAEFTIYDEAAAAEPAGADFEEAVERERHVAGYIEDVEAEPDLAGVAAEPEAELSDGYFDYSRPEPDEAEQRGAEEPADELSWHEELVATGGPEPDTAPVVFDQAVDERTEPPWTLAAPELTPVTDSSVTDDSAGALDAEPAAAAPPAAGGELGTETLADLYLAQGFAQRAAEVYRALLRQRPADERLAAKLSEAEAALAVGRSARGGEEPEAGEEPAAGEEPGEVWLRGVESAWTGGAGATGQETTPYAWTEREEQEQGIGIGSYLRELLRWGTGEPVPPEERVEETEAATAEPSAEWEEPAAEEAVLRVSPTEPEPEFEGLLAPDTRDFEPDRDELEPMTTETVLEEAWNASDATGPWSAPVEEPPLDPWLAPEVAPAGGGWPERTAHGTAPNPVEEAFNEWFGPPQEPPAPAASEAGKPRPTTEPVAVEQPKTAAEDDDDEDLEMFRAWLQSLKK